MPAASLPPSAVAFIVAGAAFLGYAVVSGRRSTSARRVDALRPSAAPRALGQAPAPRRSAAPAAPVFRASTGSPTAPMAIELSRRLRVAPDTAERVLAIGRIGLGLFFGIGLALVGYLADGSLSLMLLFYAAIGFAIGFFGPTLVMMNLASRRLRAIEAGLPEAIELLIIAVEAGLALDDALDRIVAELADSQREIADELAATSADLKILPNREEALGKFAERVDLQSVRTFVNTLSQTMRYGTPLAQALRVVGSELRNDELMRLEENANKMPVMLTIPMVVFMLPSLFLIIGGPTVLKLIRMLFH